MAAVFSKRNQLQWLALLAIAVVLPTVSLLWFMSRVIANERLVVRQKLTVLYQDKLTEAAANTSTQLTNWIADLDHVDPLDDPYSCFRHLVLEGGVQGLVIWDADGSVVYPNTAEDLGTEAWSNHALGAASKVEFGERDYARAAQLYGHLTTDKNPTVAIASMSGKSRCLSKLGKLDEAITHCQQAAFFTLSPEEDPAQRHALENARLLLLSLLKQSGQTQEYSMLFNRTVKALISDLYRPGETTLPSASRSLFIARKVLSALQGVFLFDDPGAASQLEKLVAAEERSLSAAGHLKASAGTFDGVFRVEWGDTHACGLRHRIGNASLLVLLSPERLETVLSGYAESFNGLEATYRIFDESGTFTAGTREPQGQPFTTSPLPGGFPGWTVELFFQGSDVFERAAKRQIAVYTWSGFLVIVLILAAGVFAIRAVGRQIRLNDMKNDFIATVSHELKTPLASIRVLVDTLLEGHIKDEAQVSRYLQLTAKENERLSRMIDNFLTFSRMERNKKAFTLTEAVPAEMAKDAAQAVQTKFAARDCHFNMTVAEELPDIVADHDAIVTVLINLLDNACKYTTEDKRISLRVFGQSDSVCFAVADNGIGLSRKQVRRIFESFYQVDSSLARRAEGCGLGLSIVNFIVKAHKGRVTVESKPGQGSTFTVHLPVGLGTHNEAPMNDA